MTFHGHVDESDLPSVFATFDVLAVPSIPVPGWLEQFGRVVVEGQAAGVPSVASASGALPDVVGDAGLLVPPGDPGALCAALVRVLEEPGLWSRLRDAGLASVDRYSWAGVAELQEDLYERAVHRGCDTGRLWTPAMRRAPVEGLEPVQMEVQRVPPPLPVPEGGPHGPPRRRSAGQPGERRTAASDVPRGEQRTDVAHGLDVGATGRGHHGQPVGHGLDDREAERLRGRRRQEDRRRRQQPVGVGHVSGEGHGRRTTEVGDEALEVGPQHARPGDDELPAPVPQPAGRPRPDADVGCLLLRRAAAA